MSDEALRIVLEAIDNATPIVEGLKAAMDELRTQAESGQSIQIKAEADTSALEQMKEIIAGMTAETPTIKIQAEDAATATVNAVEEAVSGLEDQTVTVTVEAGKALETLDSIAEKIDALPDGKTLEFDASESVTGTIGEISDDLSEITETNITITGEASGAKSAITEISADTQSLTTPVTIPITAEKGTFDQAAQDVTAKKKTLSGGVSFEVAANTKAAIQGLEAIKRKIDAIPSTKTVTVKTVFKGKASPEKDLTSTLADVTAKMGAFQKKAETPVTSTFTLDTSDFGEASENLKQFAESQSIAFTGLEAEMGKASGAIMDLLDRGKVSLDESFESVRAGVAEAVEESKGGWQGLTDEMVKGMVYAGKETIAEADKMGKGFNGQVDAMKANVKLLEDELTSRKEMSLDSAQAEKSIDELGETAANFKEEAETPITPEIDISPAKAAYAEMASMAHKNAVKSIKLAKEYDRAAKNSFGTERDLHQRQYDRHKKNVQRFTQEWQKYRPKANVKFTGTGSDEKPITKKITEIGKTYKAMTGDMAKSKARIDLEDSKGRHISESFRETEGAFEKMARRMKTGINLPSQGEFRMETSATIQPPETKTIGRIQIGNKAKPDEIYGRPQVLETIIDAVKKEKRMGAR